MTVKDKTAPKNIAKDESDDGTQEIIAAIRRIMADDDQELLADDLEPARLSQAAQTRIYAALGRLTRQDNKPPTVLEALILEVLEPHVQDWVERNLPNLVERLVRQELQGLMANLPNPEKH